MQLLGLFDSAFYHAVAIYWLCLGILVSIRLTGFPDLTVDGSFTIGAALFAILSSHGVPTPIALLSSAIAGAFAGMLTGTINMYLGVGKIIASVIVMLFLILITPYLSGGITVSLLNTENFFATVRDWDQRISQTLIPGSSFSLHFCFIGIVSAAAITMSFLLKRFFTKTRSGLSLRYCGSAQNPTLVTTKTLKLRTLLGLCLGNSMVAIAGALQAERSAGFNQNMGLGMLLVGLSILLLGESVMKAFRRRDHLTMGEYLLAGSVGTLVYCLGVQAILYSRLAFVDIRLSTTILLLFLLVFAARKHPNHKQLF